MLVSRFARSLTGVAVVFLVGSGLVNSSAAQNLASADGAIRSELLIDVAELEKPPKRPASRVVLDVRTAEKYAAGHWPGAAHVSVNDWSQKFGAGTDAAEWSARIAGLGIGSDSEVVVYDDQLGASAARAWWYLTYWRVPRVRVLNGGWKAIEAAGLKTDASVPPAATPAKFAAKPSSRRLTSKAELLAAHHGGKLSAEAADGWQLIDTRSAREFRGEQATEGLSRPGTIPGAKNLESRELFDSESGRLKSVADLRAILKDKEIAIERPTIAFSNTSGRASLVSFVLEYLGVSDVRSYAGGFKEWANDPETPVLRLAPPTARLESFDEVQKRLGQPRLRVFDVRPRADYDKGHIPGAVWVNTKPAEDRAKESGGLEDAEFWSKWVADLGLQPGDDILIYDSRRQLDSARLWVFLRLIGVERVGLLNGGFPLWVKENRPISTEPVNVEPREFSVTFRKDVVASRADVLTALKNNSAQVFDARSDKEYTGTEKRSKRNGHIPDACHLEWNSLVDEEGRFFDLPVLREKIGGAGVKPGAEVITHCQGGGRASVNAFALELLGIRARNYYVGWGDWGNAEETPIQEAGASTRK
ncbi:MAG: rhodanese-like domain-containing protein [Planctomycetota bacterium]|nr:rhodanese-like domain-containing protein [Planctomycetota bacterium]